MTIQTPAYTCVASIFLALFVIKAPAAITAPTEISGCRLWLDASDSSAITLESGKISVWADKSGNNKDMAQSTADNQPTVDSGAKNGLDVISFDGSDWLTGDAVLDEGDNSFTYFAVWQSSQNSGGGHIICEQCNKPKSIRRRSALATVNTTYGFIGEGCDAYTLVPHQTNI